MTEKRVQIYRSGIDGTPTLRVTASSIVVAGGSYRLGTPPVELKDDFEWDVSIFSTPTTVFGYLAADRTSREVVLFVDEVLNDGTGVPVIWDHTPYDKISELFFFYRKRAEDTPDMVEITVFDVARPQEVK